MTWNPDIYMSFADKRTRPAIELAARVTVAEPSLIYDLGCGPGNSTHILASRWPRAEIVGVDSSDEMLERARREGPANASWIKADLSKWVPDRAAEIIFSNAAYQWIDDHVQIFPALLSSLRSGGALAIQMPQNFAAPSHVLMRKVAAEGPWSEKLKPILRHDPVGDAATYYNLLIDKAETVDIWHTEYAQELEGDDPVLQWVSGTALRPLLAALDELERAAFVEKYAENLRSAYPVSKNGRTLFPFKRLFIVAKRQSG